MKAVVWHAVGDIRMDDVEEPTVEQPTDAVVRLTASAICGTDLHFVRGTMAGMQPGTILGHEGVGIVEQLGSDVRDFDTDDRVVICSTIACGTCSYCRAGCYAQCDKANPNGPDAGTSFFGGPGTTGPVNGLQAERARIPFASTTMVKLPDAVSDDQAILISDTFPTGWFGAQLAEVGTGDTVAVFGCGPVGQFAVASAKLMGDAPSQALEWAVQAVAKAGTIGIIGVYLPAANSFPIGQAMNRNLTIKAGNCNHRAYVPHLVELVRSSVIDPVQILTKVEPMTNALEAYKAFDKREPGWLKTELHPLAAE